MTTIHFLLPPATVLNQNQRLHRMVKARHTKYLRTIARRKSHGLTPITAPVELAVHVGYPDARHRDRLNYYPTAKALTDGIADNLLADDNDLHIIRDVWTSEITRRGGYEFTLTFTEAKK